MTEGRTIRVAVMLLAIFVAGGFCGWWIGRAGAGGDEMEPTMPPRGGRRPALAQKEALLNDFTGQMQLTPEQRNSISKVMDEWALEIQKANVDNLKSKQASFEKYSPFVRTNLTADQRKTFDRIMEQFERRRRRAMQNQ